TLKLVSFGKFDFVADDSDDYRRVDIGLVLSAGNTSSFTDAAPAYKDAVMLVELKRYLTEQAKAYMQLVLYTRNLFGTQPNRRFAWGLTVCGTTVRACIFVHDKVLSSEAMDVSTSDGRRVFVELLTNWTLCESWRLGYDPTIRYDAGLKHWEIDVCDSETQLTPGPVSASSQDSSMVLIKDSWAQATGPDSNVVCDEVAYLREIRDALADDRALDGTYPLLEAGGVVQIKYAGGVVDDTTQLILENIDENTRAKVPARIHRRIVMSPVGNPLQRVESADELIVVVGDVMAAHSAIAKRCGLLHRDLSVNNIMFHRDANGGVKGMLIDFNNACRITDMQTAEWQDRTGMLPFMSIGDLEQSDVERTVLDDWESLIYILCWLGTVGINQTDQGPNYMVGIAQPKVPAPSDTQFLDRNVDPAITDSFARRAEIADALADELLEVTQRFRNEALERIKSLIQDVTSVLDAAKPADEKRRSWANRFAAEVCEKLETIISSAQQSDDAGTGAKRSCEVGSLSVEPALKKAKTIGGMASETHSELLDSEQTALTSHSQLIQWISFQSSSEDPSTPASHGPDIQSGISALVGFVGQAIADMAADISCYDSMRKLSTFQKVESIATDEDSYQQLDIALTMDTGSCTDTVPDHKDALMMVA
ncbi:hypothetical protein LPJ76_006278, partial [Coemansia sp. RSA 638]